VPELLNTLPAEELMAEVICGVPYVSNHRMGQLKKYERYRFVNSSDPAAGTAYFAADMDQI
jgi:hypothetical protein